MPPLYSEPTLFLAAIIGMLIGLIVGMLMGGIIERVKHPRK